MRNPIVLVFAVFLTLASLVSGCDSTEGEGFAIYLTAQDLSAGEMRRAALSEVQLADVPLISVNDTVSYSRETHKIELTPDAVIRLEEFHVPTNGDIFIVCVDRKPIYWGIFWAGASSLILPDDVVISYIDGPTGIHSGSIRLVLPQTGEDPRSNSVIMRSLERAGKLE